MTDPRSPKSPRKGKVVNLRVAFLKDTIHVFQIPVKAVGQVLWEAVVNHMQLLESDYFGLEYANHNNDDCWLDNSKQILKQLPSPDTLLRFGVKFYTPDPGLLEDELTRYCFALQIRRDLQCGHLHCSENTAALLASYIVQGEIGDFLIDEYLDISYLLMFEFVPKGQQTTDMLHKVMDYHRQHVGESPSEADSNLLDTARKVELYGIKFHPAKDHEGVSLHLAVAHMGVLVFQGMTRINTFSWAKVRKLSFKRKKFLIKLHPESYGYYKDTVEFFFDSRDRCKYFWKKCIEHHTFFRCQTVKKPPRSKARVVSRGSSFRYSGRTQKELQEYVRETVVKRPQVERSTSGRISSRSTSVTPKISAKPSMHNSADLHNSTASSGSHILETSASFPPLPPTRLETAEIHSDSSMSGSRSLGSPRLEHGLSADSEGGDLINQPVDTAAVDARLPPHSEDYSPERGLNHIGAAGAGRGRGGHRVSPPAPPPPLHLNAALSQDSRKMSEPAFSMKDKRQQASMMHNKRLSRTDEVENIPDTVGEDNNTHNTKTHHNGLQSPNRRSLTRSASEAAPIDMYIYRDDDDDFDDLPPPPPPPPQDDEEEEEREEEEEEEGKRGEGAAVEEKTDKEKDEGEEEEDEKKKEEEGGEDEDDGDGGGGGGMLNASGINVGDVSSASIGGFPSNISSLSSGLDPDDDSRRKSKRRPADTAYYIVKELLMTERTYKKDLEVLCVWFRNAVGGDAELVQSLNDLVFSNLDPIYQFHTALLKDIDTRVTSWEGRSLSSGGSQVNTDCQRVGDLMLQAVDSMAQLYQKLMAGQEAMVMELDQRVKANKALEDAYREFESQKICYLPLNTFFLKPGQRLLHYKLILERLVKHYPAIHPDAPDCQAALTKVREMCQTHRDRLHQLDNVQKLMELQRDLIGLEHLVSTDREFLREGCLQKYSRKGYQQRMFFLFSDMLVYTSRASSSLLQFKVHGQLPLKDMTIEETEQSKVAVPNTFAIYAGGRCILVAASSQEEKNKWMEDILQAVQSAGSRPDSQTPAYSSLKSNTGSTENVDGAGGGGDERVTEKPIQHRANTTMHVCWHRNTSVSQYDHQRALKNQLSGYLLRKFKTSNGWQKLWVVFTNFCLFFYKTYQDDFPLASLPLLGYAVNPPEAEDGISKDHVFKLQFKNHVYFFRAESEYTYSRWMEVINSATSSARRTRLFSRMTSNLDSPL